MCRCGRSRHPHRLDVHELPQPEFRQLAAVPRALDPAERQPRIGLDEPVHEHAARLDLPRQALAALAIETEILRLLTYKQVSAVMRTGRPGPEGSCLKLVWSELDMRLKELAIGLEGPYAALARGGSRAIDGGRWQHEYLWSRAASIYAGTSEIQRNIIAQRVLGLPRG
jgi:alkylation response protein AidB-like acyl-CoA dehydrogenase